MDNLEKLQKLLEITNQDYIKTDDFVEVFQTLLVLLSQVKDESSAELASVLSETEGKFRTLQSEYKRIANNIQTLDANKSKDFNNLYTETTKAIQNLKSDIGIKSLSFQEKIDSIIIPDCETPQTIREKLLKASKLPLTAIETDSLLSKSQFETAIIEIGGKLTVLEKRNPKGYGGLGGGSEGTGSLFLSRLRDVNLTGLTKTDGKYDLGSGSSSGGNYTPQGITTATVGGIASGTNLGTTLVAIQSILDAMLYPYQAPGITLNVTPASGNREKGNSISSVALSAITTKTTNPITSVVFKRGGSIINTVSSPSPTGGTETYTESTPVTTTTLFTAEVSDGTQTTISNTRTYTFISAYYYGVGAPGLTPTQVSALTKVVQGNTTSYATTTSPTAQVYYFAYPDSYPALTSIKDPSNFETILDYNVSTGNSITNSFGNADTYRIYEFKNLTTQISFTNTYIQ